MRRFTAKDNRSVSSVTISARFATCSFADLLQRFVLVDTFVDGVLPVNLVFVRVFFLLPTAEVRSFLLNEQD